MKKLFVPILAVLLIAINIPVMSVSAAIQTYTMQAIGNNSYYINNDTSAGTSTTYYNNSIDYVGYWAQYMGDAGMDDHYAVFDLTTYSGYTISNATYSINRVTQGGMAYLYNATTGLQFPTNLGWESISVKNLIIQNKNSSSFTMHDNSATSGTSTSKSPSQISGGASANPPQIQIQGYSTFTLNSVDSAGNVSWQNNGALVSGDNIRVYYKAGSGYTASQIISGNTYVAAVYNASTAQIPSLTPGTWSVVVLEEQNISSTLYTGASSNVQTVIINTAPTISADNTTTSQTVSWTGTATISGTVTDPDNGQTDTISATINGVTKQTTVAAPASSAAWSLSWSGSELGDGSYTNITVTANDGTGSGTSTYTGTIAVDATPPATSAPTATSIQTTSITVYGSAADAHIPLQYLFNINGADQGTWQSSSYTFTGLTANTSYPIKYKAVDAFGNISQYSTVLNITTANAPVGGTTTMTNPLLDEFNDGNAHDIRVMFGGAADETHIQEYRIIASKAVIDTSTASGYDNTKYTLEPVKGKGRLHLINLAAGQKDDTGLSIVNGTAYNIYVLAVAKTGYANSLTSLGTITLSPNVPLTGLYTPTVRDMDNNNNASDLSVTFKKPTLESDIQEYRIFVWNTSAPAFDLASANNNTNYKQVLPDSGNRYGYTVNLDSSMLDTRGNGNPIVNGQTYKIYVLAVMSKTGMSNMLSSPSRAITLSASVPSALPARGFSAAKVGSGHAGSNISVTFSEPLSVINVQEYRVFIVPSTGTLDAVTATSLDNTKYIQVSSTARGTAHTVTLTGLDNTYDGTALAAGSYKAYVLTVGKTSQYANRLAAPSKAVTLD